MDTLRFVTVFLISASCLLLPSPASAVSVSVTSTDDDGSGSFRDAVEQATVNAAIDSIVFKKNLGTILIDSSIVYGGSQALTIKAGRATIEPANSDDFDLFIADGGGDLEIEDLTVRNGGGNGILVAVPPAASGVISVVLSRVHVLDNAGFGVLIDDQEDPLDDENQDGSDAGLYLSMSFCTALRNGFVASDLDGVRAQEGGAGSIVAKIDHCAFDENGADGLELDERGDGDVKLTAKHSSFDENGPTDPEDLDDGLDIDELGDGDVEVYLFQVSASDNFQEGLDFDEAGDGHLELVIEHVRVEGNGLELQTGPEEGFEDGADLGEEGEGDVWLVVKNGTFSTSGDRGLEVSEEGGGDFIAELTAVVADGNASDGIGLEEADDGDLIATLRACRTRENGDEGMQLEEGDEGDFDVEITGTRVADNADHGIQAEQDDDNGDVGILFLRGVTFKGNGDDDLDTDGVDVIQNGP